MVFTEVVQEAVREQAGSTPPSSTVAVMVLPPTPLVSTVIDEVPWPPEIVPAETDQLYVRFIEPESPTEAVKASGSPSLTSLGQLTDTVGHGGLHSVQTATVTVVVAFAVCWLPSLTSTEAVYVPGLTPERSQLTVRPSPVIRPPVTVQV